MVYSLDTDKVKSLAKPSHARCSGTGIMGYKTKTHHAVLCQCVARALLKDGINLHNPFHRTMLREAIGKEVKLDYEPERVGAQSGA